MCTIDPPRGPIVIFEDDVAPGWYDWSWNTTYGGASDPEAGSVLAVNFNGNWAGLELNKEVVKLLDHSILLLSVKTAQPEELYLGIRRADTGEVPEYVLLSDYVPGNQGERPSAGVWRHFAIPLSDLDVVGEYVSGFVLQSADAGTVWLDDVMIVDPVVLKWPLDGSKNVSGFNFGDEWTVSGTQCPSGTWKLHTGTDYTASPGDNVYAVESGVVKHNQPHDDGVNNWGYHIVVESTTEFGRKFNTVYWHVTPVAGLGSTVTKGQHIADIANISSGPHLHFGVWIGDYETYGEFGPAVGALPVDDCANWPAFPAGFVNPDDTKFVLFE